jgi:aryl-alcohol dehydrogenase-like predicted oxidoreductase
MSGVGPHAGPVERIELADGYSIARIVNGAWQLSAGHRRVAIDREAAIRGLLRRAEAGLTTFDCADIYTGVEELLGDVIRAWRRRGGDTVPPALEIHTKLVPDLAALPTLARRDVERLVERSLARLGVERLDLVQLHWWDYEVPGFVEAAGWLDDLRRAGKVRHLGVTNVDAPHLAALLDAGIEVVSHQTQYSVVDRRPEHALAELARDRGVGLLCYGTLAGGFLSERWLGAPEPEGPAEELPNRSLTKYKLILDELGPWELVQELLAVLDRIARRRGVALSAVALRWVLDRPGVAAAIVGATGDRHLERTLEAFRLALDGEDRAAIEGVVARAVGPAGDVYALERVPGGRHAKIMRHDLNEGVEEGPGS